MEQRVSLITLGVADMARSRAFYERGLGWTALPGSPPEVSFYQLPGLGLALFGLDDLAKDADTPMVRATGPITIAINFADKAGVDAAYAQALAAGGKALKAPVDAPWGGYSGYFADPDGHAWEVAWNPACRFTEWGGTLFGDA